MRVLALTLAVLLGGCPPSAAVCPLRATRCADDVVEVCDARGRWQTVADCADVARSSGGEWSCSTTREDGREINACLPVEAPR